MKSEEEQPSFQTVFNIVSEFASRIKDELGTTSPKSDFIDSSLADMRNAMSRLEKSVELFETSTSNQAAISFESEVIARLKIKEIREEFFIRVIQLNDNSPGKPYKVTKNPQTVDPFLIKDSVIQLCLIEADVLEFLATISWFVHQLEEPSSTQDPNARLLSNLELAFSLLLNQFICELEILHPFAEKSKGTSFVHRLHLTVSDKRLHLLLETVGLLDKKLEQRLRALLDDILSVVIVVPINGGVNGE